MATLKAFGVGDGQSKHYEEAVYSVTLINNIINKKVNNAKVRIIVLIMPSSILKRDENTINNWRSFP